MRVRIFVQDDLTALVVPLINANKTLSPDKEKMKTDAIKIKDAEIDDPIIGMNQVCAKQSIAKNGYYENVL